MRKKTSLIWTTSSEDFRKHYDACSSFKELLSCFGLKNKGNNCVTLRKRLEYEGLAPYKIVKRRAWTKVATVDLLKENSDFARHALKKRLISEKLLDYRCSECGIEPIWNNKVLSLVLDHINGISNDNRLDNLRFLCPNCNSQTSTFSGKNKKKVSVQYDTIRHYNNCKVCGLQIAINRVYCDVCFKNEKRTIYPGLDVLQKLVLEVPIIVIAKDLGISETALRKYCNKHNILRHPKGYWQKNKNYSGLDVGDPG